jgi:glycosyltransferase involved in cell wall biosynthesis
MTPLERVSILIPAHNAARTIERTLQSARRQTYPNIEIIVIDDGSRDATAEIVASHAAVDPCVRLFRQHNAGVAAARNYGLRQATGALIAPLDADDIWHPEKISRQVRRLSAEGTAAGVVYCWFTDIDEHDTIIEHRLDLDRYEGDVYAALVLGNFVGNSSVPLIRKALLDSIGGWDATLRSQGAQGCEDWLAYLQLAERCAFVLEPGFLVGYRRIAGAMSSDVQQMKRSANIVLGHVRTAHPELPRRLLRWSRAGFAYYSAEAYWASGQAAAAARSAVESFLLDPTVLVRASVRRRLLGRLKLTYRGFQTAFFRRAPPTLAALPYPIGLNFRELATEPHRIVGEGAQIERRRRTVANVRIGGIRR